MKKHTVRAFVVPVISALCGGLVATPVRAADDLLLTVATGSESVMPGDNVTVTLDVANLTAPINGVQGLIRYDTSLLSLVSIVATDLGLIPPANGWTEVYFSDVLGDVTYTIVANGGSSATDSTIATFTFTAIAEGTTGITFRPDIDPFYTKLTIASDNTTVLPAVVDSGTISSGCDDGFFCNGLETFDGLTCQPGTPPDCTGLTDQCNNGVCDEAIDACIAATTNEGLSCSDGSLCTTGDVCTLGVCGGTSVDCSSLNDACNLGTCNLTTGLCEPTPANEGGSCDDLLFCTGTDTCSGGVCLSSGDPCTPMLCDEATDSCLAPVHITDLQVFYSGRFSDQTDPSKYPLAAGSIATLNNITTYINGITGIRVVFDQAVTFATTPAGAFFFDYTSAMGTSFSPVPGAATAFTVTDALVGGVTEVSIVINDNYIRRRWLMVTIDATQITVGGVELDGELQGNPITMPSGDGTLGGNPVFYLGSITGDVDGDRKTLLTDIGLIRASVNPFFTVPITDLYDVDKDGKVLLTDVGNARLDVNPFFTLPLISP